MKTIVRVTAGQTATGEKDEIELQGVDSIGFTAEGAIVLTDNKKQVLGVFLPGNIVGIYHPDGRDIVQAVSGSIVQLG